MPGGELFAAAHVDDGHALVDQLLDLGGVDLDDLALDAAEKLRSGRAHFETPKPWSGFKGTSESIAPVWHVHPRFSRTLSRDVRTPPARPARRGGGASDRSGDRRDRRRSRGPILPDEPLLEPDHWLGLRRRSAPRGRTGTRLHAHRPERAERLAARLPRPRDDPRLPLLD